MSSSFISEKRKVSILKRLADKFPQVIYETKINEAEGMTLEELEANMFYLWDHNLIMWWKVYVDDDPDLGESDKKIRITAKGIDWLSSHS